MSDRLVQSFFNVHNLVVLCLLCCVMLVTLTPQYLLPVIPPTSATSSNPQTTQDITECPEVVIEPIYRVNDTHEAILRQEILTMKQDILRLTQELYQTAQAIPSPKIIEVEKFIPTKDPELEEDLDYVIGIVNDIAKRQETVVNAVDSLKQSIQQHDQHAQQRLLTLSTGVSESSNEDIQQKFAEIQQLLETNRLEQQAKAQELEQLNEEVYFMNTHLSVLTKKFQELDDFSKQKTSLQQNKHVETAQQINSAVQMVYQAFKTYRSTVTDMIEIQQQKCAKKTLKESEPKECPSVPEVPEIDEEEIKSMVNELLQPVLLEIEQFKSNFYQAGTQPRDHAVASTPKKINNESKVPKNDFALYSTGTRVVQDYTSPKYFPEQFRVDSTIKSVASNVGLSSDVVPPIDGQQIFENLGVDYGVGSANEAIDPSLEKGRCWGMKGTNGELVLKLSHAVSVSSISIDHISR